MKIVDYSIDELMACCLARGIKDGDLVFHGVASPLPMTALRTAKMTHAPHMVYFAGVGGGVDPSPPFLPESTNDIWLQWGSVRIETIDRVFDHFARGEVNIMFFSGAQFDKFGNVNNSLIGDWQHPKTKFPGGAGACNLSSLVRIMAWSTRHKAAIHPKSGKKLYTFVEKLDFRTTTGFMNGPGDREAAGCRPGTGPVAMVTELGVFDYDESTKVLRLKSVHPDVTVQDVLDNTEFKPVIPSSVPVTEAPTKEMVRLMRTVIDPYRIRALEFRDGAAECDKRRFKF
jgi:glutaconate CoA-transferase, subunit B